MSAPSLSVIIPTRNERENVPRLLGAVRDALRGIDYELLFVDDSTDGTDEVLARVARDDPKVRVYHRDVGNGLAGAVVEGIGLSRGDCIGVLDADLQHPPQVVPVMLKRLREAGADVVVASRYLSGAGHPGLSPARALISWTTRRLAQVMLRAARRSTDPLSGCFLLRRGVVDGVTLRPIGFKILLEVLVRGRYERVVDVPYVFVGRDAGRTKATLRQGLDLLLHVARLVTSSPDDARLWKFLLVGASGVVVNMVVFWFLVHPVGVHILSAGVVAGLLSTFTNFILNNAFTWADRKGGGVSIFVQRLGRYYVATWAGYLIYLGLLWGLTHLGLVPMLANLISVGVGGLFNYVMHNVWTWRGQAHG
ncbi:MAG: glycosyltransferase family 2 protein [Armatimonadota bacterium]|nr:glycosyltransferase family 2 protein [Armatimonadota bacterium]